VWRSSSVQRIGRTVIAGAGAGVTGALETGAAAARESDADAGASGLRSQAANSPTAQQDKTKRSNFIPSAMPESEVIRKDILLAKR
jgi:hypothetical protein